MTRKDEIEKLSPNDSRYLDAAKIADSVLAGLIQDPTVGALPESSSRSTEARWFLAVVGGR